MLPIGRVIYNKIAHITHKAAQCSNLHTACVLKCKAAAVSDEVVDDNVDDDREQGKVDAAVNEKSAAKDRTRVIPVETSMRYMKSAAYKQTYGDQPVWVQYRRNHKGMYAPRKTRKTCIRQKQISTGNPCPICRDEYLVLDHRNTELLNQFISPQTGEVLSYSKTGLCQKSHLRLLVAVERARDYGLITFDVPFRVYDYSEYSDKVKNT